MECVMTRVVYIFNTGELEELRVLADRIEQKNGWVLAIWKDHVIGGVKEEYLKAFCLEAVD